MECIYWPDLSEINTSLIISGTESRHVKALRLTTGDEIRITNGKGLAVIADLIDFDKISHEFRISKRFMDQNEIKSKITLAISILDNKDRMEFALEKSIELGISEFIPLISDFTQKNTINADRLKKKAIAALKQSKRSVLPHISKPLTLNKLIDSVDKRDIILADIEGTSILPDLLNDPIILVGPEGGYSKTELKVIGKSNPIKLKLSHTRLRAETAAIATVTRVVSEFL